MPLTARPLHDGWTVRATAGPVPAAITAAAPIAAEVPGCVHLDLMRAGLIPDPYLDDNESLLAWIGLVDWEYRGICARSRLRRPRHGRRGAAQR